jgi:hypothetical protein
VRGYNRGAFSCKGQIDFMDIWKITDYKSLRYMGKFAYVATPLVLYLSWKYWRIDERKKSINLSIFQFLLSTITFLFLFGSLAVSSLCGVL